MSRPAPRASLGIPQRSALGTWRWAALEAARRDGLPDGEWRELAGVAPPATGPELMRELGLPEDWAQ